MKQFKVALWPNENKYSDTSPDATGSLQMPVSVLKEILQAYKASELPITQDYTTKEDCLTFRASAWRNPPSDGKPVISCQIDSPTEAKERAAKKAQRDAEQAGQNSQQDDLGWDAPF